ncbi:unnamed protein product [marine sediment metagenome]|uniref:Glycosyltransferase 2-like domain-containing protein n=1 Tax=marine sediment metagenome TaxID=412755 RepID=X1KHU6_9ZZZZ
MAPKLSILLPGLEKRAIFRQILDSLLVKQTNNQTEVIQFIDNGEISIGVKRQRMLEKATGDYIVFIDDDDLVSHNYVSLILGGLKDSPDCIGIHLLHYQDSWLLGKTYHSIKFSHWWEEPDKKRGEGMLFYRNPNHLNPVRRDIALKVGFPDLTLGEDRHYSMGILPFLNTEVYIEEPIYFYHERAKKVI